MLLNTVDGLFAISNGIILAKQNIFKAAFRSFSFRFINEQAYFGKRFSRFST